MRKAKEIKAVIMAGGKGTRLRPYTFILPKPLMPVGDQPVIAMLLKWLRRWNIKEAIITTGYLGYMISAVCKDGSQWDIDIRYSTEPEPLGTIGALLMVEDQLDDTFIVINSDLITDLDLGSFIDFHNRHDGLVTVATTQKPVKVDLGVLESDGGKLCAFKEKPKLDFEVSMGIYCMEPSILRFIPKGVPFGFDNLMHVMLDAKLPVYLFRHEGLWLDIGREEDFSHAQASFLRDYKSVVLGA